MNRWDTLDLSFALDLIITPSNFILLTHNTVMPVNVLPTLLNISHPLSPCLHLTAKCQHVGTHHVEIRLVLYCAG